MHFTQIKIKNFGPFSSAAFHFEPRAINWFVGGNGSGKTQMAGAILAAIIGKRALSITAGGTGPSAVDLTMEDEGVIESVSLMVIEQPQGKLDVSKTTGPLTLQILAMMSESEGQRLFVSDERGADIKPPDFLDMANSLPETVTDDPFWERLRQRRVFGRQAGSSGEYSILELIKQLVYRRRARFKLPLIIDEVVRYWPQDLFPFIYRLLGEIAKDSQVIVLAPRAIGAQGHPVHVISTTHGGSSLSAFNSSCLIHDHGRRRASQSMWIKGAHYPGQESRICEFKEVKGGNPLGSIKSVVDQYVVAFLNAGLQQEGAIFWGIRDHDRAIVGVQLRPHECDELRRIVTERLHQIVPSIAPTAYRINLHPVGDGLNVIDDLYVVEVRVPSIRRTLLFATGGQDVYVRTDAGKRKLSALELQQELVRRLGVDTDF